LVFFADSWQLPFWPLITAFLSQLPTINFPLFSCPSPTVLETRMRPNLFFVLAIPVAIGCSSSYEAGTNAALDKSFLVQVNENARDRHVAITTSDGKGISATRLLVGRDSTSFLESTTDTRMTIATSSVGIVRITHAGAGAVDGLFWGALIGTPIGIFLGKGAAVLEDNGDFLDWMVVAGSVGASGVIGAIVGVSIRHTDEYIFPVRTGSRLP
jgi:hypothetical protein